MKKTILFASALAVLMYALTIPSACFYDNEEDLYGETSSCDTAGIRYSVEIKAILAENCDKCHIDGASEFSGYELGNYDALKAYVDDGKLIERTNDASSPMPPKSDGGLLPDCDRQKIKAWVNAGAPNN